MSSTLGGLFRADGGPGAAPGCYRPQVQAVFCHGLESGPTGRKSLALREAGIAVDTPDFRGQDLAQRIATFDGYLARSEELPVVIGSSYGGLLALCAGARLHQQGRAFPAMLLCAPAIHRAEAPADELELAPHCPTVIVHGKGDAIVPIETSRKLAREHPDRVELIEVDDNHSLSSSIGIIIDAAARLIADSRA